MSRFGLTSCSQVILREYHYVNLKMNWTDAQHYCRVKYTDLATFDNMDDINRLNRPSLETSLAWIGLTDDPKSWTGNLSNDANSWRWSATGETGGTGYHNWYPGYPNNYGGIQLCVYMGDNGLWDDWTCPDTFSVKKYKNETNKIIKYSI
uniref:C-type lectin domain-containing protein n=1 Tax=Stegastes partitus TaxID=144197 RepID=A0A3B4Z4N7_9TELE